MTDFVPTVIHTTRPGGSTARCGATSGELVTWGQVVDHEHPGTFTCGGCWLDAAGGVEPMGGSQYYLPAAHEHAVDPQAGG